MRRVFNLREVVQTQVGSIIRFVITTSVAFSAATFSNWIDYKSYWDGTIYRTQTVDFNMLSYTLPTKLSYALQQKDTAEVQRTLNSNYGLFGLVMTDCKTEDKDCPTQRFWYYSQSDRNWKQKLQLEDLPNHSYDLLRNPPPLFAEGKYDSPRANNRITTGKNNVGKIVGRVYYIRGIPPTFLEDYWRWMQNPLSTSGAHKLYTLTITIFLVGGFASWTGLEFFLYKKRIKEIQHQRTLEQIRKEHKKLIYQFRDQLKRNQEESTKASLLISEYEHKIYEFNNHNQRLKQKITQIQTQVAIQSNNPINNAPVQKLLEQKISILQQQLTQSKQRELEAKNREEKIISQLKKEQKTLQVKNLLTQQLENKIDQLKNQLAVQFNSQSHNDEARGLLQKEISSLQKQLDKSRQDTADSNQAIISILEQNTELQERWEKQHSITQELENKITELQNVLVQQETDKKYNHERIRFLQEQSAELEQQLKQSEKQKLEAQSKISQLNSSIVGLNEEMKNQIDRINILEDQSFCLDKPNALFIPLEPDGRDLSLTDLRKELGLEEIFKSGVVTRIFYSDRYLYERGGGILADLIIGNWLRSTSHIKIKVLEQPNEQPAAVRKQRLELSFSRLRRFGSIFQIEVQPYESEEYFNHARLLEINMESGKKYKLIFDQGMQFIKFNSANNTYRIKETSYVTLTTTEYN
ncbi:hypothetical protein NIES4103_09580 [Nostoc sp. NIES-4103]|nr:hypothetical protein NIES4103_09580 [Nostoc sp. NIES-4103]